MKMTPIILVDDHHIIIDGLKTILSIQQEFEVVATADNGQQALALIDEFPETEIVLADINMPNLKGLELCKILKKQHSHVKVIFLTMHDSQAIIHSALDVEADGYLLKNSDTNVLMESLQKVRDGGTCYDQQILPIIKERISREKWQNKKDFTMLTNRELEILILLTREFTSEEIASKLYISKKKVDNHRASLLEKTGCKSTIGLVKFALSVGIVG